MHAMDLGWIPHKPETWTARFGDLKKPVVMRTWNGHGADPEFTEETALAGTTVKIVMVSRFGDIGITTDLSAKTGYLSRIDVDDLDNLRMVA
jgi:hypothetical protein